jgi:hypothetical protein
MANTCTVVSLALCLLLSSTRVSAQESLTAGPLPPVEDAPQVVPAEERPLPVLRSSADALPPFEASAESVTTNLVTGDSGDVYLGTPPISGPGVFLNAKTAALPNVTARIASSTSTSRFSVLNSSNDTLFMVRGDGFNGFGITSPSAKVTSYNARPFAVGGTTQGDIALQGVVLQSVAAGASNPGNVTGGYLQAWNSGSGFLQDAYGLRIFAGNYDDNTGTTDRAFGIRLKITNDAGTLNSGYGLYIEDIPAAATYAIYAAGDDRVYLGGGVGIGTAPVMKLEVLGNAATNGAARRVARFWDATAMAAGVGGGLDLLGKYTAAGGYSSFANIKGVKATATDGDADGNLVISVNDNGNMYEAVRIARNEMTVTGNAQFSGTVTGSNISATYQDLAEWVPTTQELAAGTVVVLDPKAANHVIASTTPYDTTVAGVVSPQPGVILGVAGPSKAMIATTGRVRVRVDATAAPIAIGDLLVTGTRPGLAMKTQPVEFGGVAMHRPGTVVGKALEALEGGEGEILVLLSLQ